MNRSETQLTMMTRLKTFSRQHPNITTILIVLALFGLAQLILGTRATPLDSPQDLAALLTDGQPSVLAFYSNL